MRKYIRQMMRAKGKKEYRKSVKANTKKKVWEKKEHVSPTMVVRYFFNEYQIDKYGKTKRDTNMACGTHVKKLWPSRLLLK